MDSLTFNLVDSQEELKNKKIIAIEILECYPIGYIIVETGEYFAFTINCDEIEVLSPGQIERVLLNNDTLLTRFFNNRCISEEYYNHILDLREKRTERVKESNEKREYKEYLRLKAKFESNS